MKLKELFEQYDELEEYGKGDLGYIIQTYELITSTFPDTIRIDLENKKIIATNCSLTSLNGCPEKLNYLNVAGNLLRDLEGGPLECRTFGAESNPYLTSIQHAPEKVTTFSIDDCNLSSLSGIGRKYLKECEFLYIRNNPFKSSLLGIMLVKELPRIYFDNKEVQDIFNRHLKGDKDILDCQEELITKGFKEYAKL